MKLSAITRFFISALFLLKALIITSCSNDSTSPNPPAPSGPVLLATVTGDSVATSLGSSAKISNIGGHALNCTDKDSLEITFSYAGTPNNSVFPLRIYYSQDTVQYNVYYPGNLNLTSSGQTVNVTLPSPKVNTDFYYRIQAVTTGGLCYFRFNDMKIYKK